MTRSAERNDVDITKLFRYEKEVIVKDDISGDSVKLYLRIIGDADMNVARVAGLRDSAETRRELKEDGSDMRTAFVSELPEFQTKEVLVESLILLMTGEIYKEATNNANVPEPQPPKGDASLEEMEKFQKEVDAYPEVHTKGVEKEAEKIKKRERKALEKHDEETLYKVYENLIIDRICTEQMGLTYYSMCVYLGAYGDPRYKKRSFNSYEEYDNSSPYLKGRLTEAYRMLELGMDDLKK